MWLTAKDEAPVDTRSQLWCEDPGGIPEDEISCQEAIHRAIHDEIKYHRDLGIPITVYRRHSRLLEMIDPSDLDFEAFMKTLRAIFDSFGGLRILHLNPSLLVLCAKPIYPTWGCF